MLSWFRRNVSCSGLALFRDSLPPRAEELDGLAMPPGERWETVPDKRVQLHLRPENRAASVAVALPF